MFSDMFGGGKKEREREREKELVFVLAYNSAAELES